jgi:sialate O-acetylesterase
MRASLRLPEVLGDHMVLQQNTEVSLWGWAFTGEIVKIETSWGARTQAIADASGCWRVKVRTPHAQPLSHGLHPEHVTFTVAGEHVLQIKDVLIGEVWLCSGQSNMEMQLRPWAEAGWSGELHWPEESKHADRPGLRMLNVMRTPAMRPQDDCRSILLSQGTDSPDQNGLIPDNPRGWIACTSATAPYFHAIPYYFAAALQEKLDVPVGIVASVVGGTVAESWMSLEALRTVPSFEHIAPVMMNPIRHGPACLYNGMIAPLSPMTIKGVAWYQGEANVSINPDRYAELFDTLIADWRRAFGNNELPFYFVQIAPVSWGTGPNCAEIREAQASIARRIPNTGMAVSIDVGEADNIHPRDKRTVGQRLAAQALVKTYGQHDLVADGPSVESVAAAGARIRIHFRDTGGGLVSRDGRPLTCFEIAGSDGIYQPATAIVEGDAVLISSATVPQPQAVRFAWGEADIPNLTGKNGLPVPQFRWALSANLPAQSRLENVFPTPR